ncbi:MAG: hypothetical protein NZ992_02680 [Candidatus Korarchaeum sp.]|nr:hypothetical protein [Candidatus Korarchaeum sp.]MDW8034904.1 hypothetical protein [Candidatus Korarchaeum sp.]
MKVRLGILISGSITFSISFLMLYASIIFLNKFSLSYIGVALSIILAILSVAVFIRKSIAIQILSIFYFILALVGILLALSLPPEGLLVSLPSLAIATYLWRYIRCQEEKFSEDSRHETEEDTFPLNNSLTKNLFSQ